MEINPPALNLKDRMETSANSGTFFSFLFIGTFSHGTKVAGSRRIWHNGITLIEILTAIFLGTLFLVPFFNLISFNERLGKTTLIRMKSSALANEKMEELKALGFSKLEEMVHQASGNQDGPFKAASLAVEEDPNWRDGSAFYRRTAEVHYFPYVDPTTIALDPADMEFSKYRLLVTVTVTYVDGSNPTPGKAKSNQYQLTSLLTREDLFKITEPGK